MWCPRAVSLQLLTLLLVSPAIAQDQPETEPVRTERSGFWFRGNLGLGPALFSSDDGEVSGAGGLVALSFGKFVRDDLIAYAELGGASITGPTFKSGGVSLGTDDNVSAGVFQFGFGVAYYLRPESVFLAGTVTTAQMSLDVDDETVAETDMGFGLSLMLGKDFVVSRRWTLGGAAHVLLGRMNDKGGGPSWSTRAVGLSFTFSFAREGWG